MSFHPPCTWLMAYPQLGMWVEAGKEDEARKVKAEQTSGPPIPASGSFTTATGHRYATECYSG